MRNSLFMILLLVTVITGCKNTNNKEEIKKPNDVVQIPETDIFSTTWMNDMQLNNDAKWAANLETTEGVEKMKEVLQTQSTLTIGDYHQLAGKLNDVKIKIVKECTMKGASHDNLHIWLYPLIEKINVLSKTGSLNEASKIKQSIIENLEVYPNYFE
tara:strand:+ start:26548 stop:27018 length:471 start_codon:yes stop_codon:yes gene_type:complete